MNYPFSVDAEELERLFNSPNLRKLANKQNKSLTKKISILYGQEEKASGSTGLSR